MLYSIFSRCLIGICSGLFLVVFLTGYAAAKPVVSKNMVVISDADSLTKPAVKTDVKAKKGNKAGIKEVPKSRPNIKPMAVKVRIKIKTPVKRIKPLIRRPLGLIKRRLAF